MIRSLTCIVLGSILIVTGSWHHERPGESVGDTGLEAIKGSGIHQQVTSLACEFDTLAPGEVLPSGCGQVANGTPCIVCTTALDEGLTGFVENGGNSEQGYRKNGQVNCNTYIRSLGKCNNGGCGMYKPGGVCADAVNDFIDKQLVTELPPGGA